MRYPAEGSGSWWATTQKEGFMSTETMRVTVLCRALTLTLALAFGPAAAAPTSEAKAAPGKATQSSSTVDRHPVIARVWRGRTSTSKADEYETYLNQSGVSKIRATPGNLGVYVLRRKDNEKTEFVVMSLWESVDAIKKFAGADYQKAVILPRDREYLLEVEPNVVHYEVARVELTPSAGVSH
jgi:heme-degrading monooxygenase HmoA